MAHPKALHDAGKSGPVRAVRAQQIVRAGQAGPRGRQRQSARRACSTRQVKLGTSTPKADPSGDYAFEVFARPKRFKPGAQAALEAKALQADRRQGQRRAAGGPHRLWLARGGRPRRHLPHLLHQCDGRAEADIPASRSWHAAGRACGRRRLRPDGHERRAGGERRRLPRSSCRRQGRRYWPVTDLRQAEMRRHRHLFCRHHPRRRVIQ